MRASRLRLSINGFVHKRLFADSLASSLRFGVIFIASAVAGFGALGSIGGLVTDPSQAVIPAAEVFLKNEETGFQRTTLTDATGFFVFPLLTPGLYQVRAIAPGFEEASRAGIVLRAVDALRIDLGLAIQGQQPTSIDVQASLVLLETESAAQGQVIGAREIAQLPLNQRDFLSLALLAPGVTPPTYGSFIAKEGGAIHVSGSREQANMYLLDGVENSNPIQNRISFSPPVGAIDQFRIQSANSPSEFGRLSGGQIDIVLKSGTNSLHGSLFGLVRNRNLDARNFFDRPPCRSGLPPDECGEKAALDRTQFGATIGGPLSRDRAFFFLAYEGLRLRQGDTRQSTVPSVNQRADVLSKVPASERSTAGLATLDLFPLPNVDPADPTSSAYVASPLTRDSIDRVLLKLDYLMSDGMRLTGHYGLYDERRTEPYDTNSNFTTLPGYGVRAPVRSHRISTSLTQIPNPRLVMDTRFAWNSPRNSTIPQNQGNDWSATLAYPTIASNPEYFGFPSVSVAGFTAIGEGRRLPEYSASDVLNVAHNSTRQSEFAATSHLFQFGGSFRYVSSARRAPLYPRGYWLFTGGFGVSPLEDLVRGRPSAVLAGHGDSAFELKTWSGAAYLSDNIHIGRSLSVHTGLRYEFNRPPHTTDSPFTVPDTRFEAASCSPKPGCLFVPAAELGLPSATFYPDRNNFGPRIGVSWRPPALSHMVLRSAYGLFYNNAGLTQMSPYGLNPPFFSLLSYPNDGSRAIQTAVEQPPLESLALAYRMAPDLRDAYVQQWNLSLQFELAQSWVLETAYVGSKGTHLPGSTDSNQPPEGGGSRRFPQHGPILTVEPRASSNYNSMQARLERRLQAGTNLLVAYTWSKSIDDASSYTGLAQAETYAPQDSSTRRGERALSTFNTAQRLSVAYLQELPSLTRKGGLFQMLFGGWQVAAIGSFNSGHPFPILRQVDQSGTGFGPLGDASDRPDVIGDPMRAGPVLSHPDPSCHMMTAQGGRAAVRTKVPASWFNPCAFAAPDRPRFGNSARNNVIGPGLANIDTSIAKYFSLPEKRRLELRVEAFNILNTPQFDLPEHHYDSSRFGAISSSDALGTTPPRQIQVMLSFEF